MIARIATMLCLLALAAPAAALAQSPFDPIPPAPQPQPTVAEPQDNRSSQDDGLSSTQQLLIGLSGLILLFGIGWAIMRDAHAAAPVHHDEPGEDVHRPKGSRTPARVRHQQSRAKSKAARQARKKARKR